MKQQVVIEIYEEYYDLIKRDAKKGEYLNVLERAVVNGTPLEEYCRSQNYCRDYIFATESEDDE